MSITAPAAAENFNPRQASEKSDDRGNLALNPVGAQARERGAKIDYRGTFRPAGGEEDTLTARVTRGGHLSTFIPAASPRQIAARRKLESVGALNEQTFDIPVSRDGRGLNLRPFAGIMWDNLDNKAVREDMDPEIADRVSKRPDYRGYQLLASIDDDGVLTYQLYATSAWLYKGRAVLGSAVEIDPAEEKARLEAAREASDSGRE